MQYRNIIDCGIKTFRAEGAIGLFRGFNITLLRDIPSFAGYFMVYEGGKRVVASMGQKPESMLTPAELLVCGGMAGFGAWLPCYPQDVLKSRIQTKQLSSIRGAFEGLLLESGWRGLFRGIGPTMVRAFPANAATFLAYEMMQSWLTRSNRTQ